MRILFVTNATRCCGVAEFGRQHVEALRALGHVVVEWCPGYDYQRWPTLEPYDVVHVNYHPGTLNHLKPLPFAGAGVFVSAYLHEPTSQWGFGTIDCAFAAEGLADNEYIRRVYLIPMPVVDYEAKGYYKRLQTHAATSSLRQAGVDWVAPTLEKWGIVYDHGQNKGATGGWVPIEEEIERLNSADFLVYWYPGANAGQSAGLTTAIAAQRPIVLNHNRMFESVEGYADELYFADDLEEGLRRVTLDLRNGVARVPRRLKKERGWLLAAKRMAEIWERMIEL